MSVNPDLVNLVFEPTPSYVVGREKVREFARAVMAFDPLHHDVSYARNLGFVMLWPHPRFPW